MLHSLYIKNYRNLKELRINSLKRVNLITGKNNTGKSTILEAIAIYASKGEFNSLNELLIERGEKLKRTYRQSEGRKNNAESNIRTLSSLFTDRHIKFDKRSSISIGEVDNTLFGKDTSPEKSVSLRFLKYFDEIKKETHGTIRTRKEISTDEETADFSVGLEIRVGDRSHILEIDGDGLFNIFGLRGIGNEENFQFIRTRNIDKEINGKLWDDIALTEMEYYVVEALKIIEPSTERIAFIEDGNSRERNAVIKLSNSNNVLPLRSMGDGINRILTIILALVNSDNGFLLIDEFENGLHHTVQEKLWEIIFKLSKELNVQVFVTTHSEDCIAGFADVLNRFRYEFDGKLVRLDNINGIIKTVEFDSGELKIAFARNIETR